MVERRSRVERGQQYLDKNEAKLTPAIPAAKKGKVVKKVAKAVKAVKKAVKAPIMKKGGKTKSCRGGCY